MLLKEQQLPHCTALCCASSRAGSSDARKLLSDALRRILGQA